MSGPDHAPTDESLIQAAGDMLSALLVITLTPEIADWLAKHDPKALRQANHAVAQALAAGAKPLVEGLEVEIVGAPC